MVVAWLEKGLLPFERRPNGPLRVSEKGLITFLKHQDIDIEEVMAKILGRDGPGSPDEKPAQAAAPQIATEVLPVSDTTGRTADGPIDEDIIDATVEPPAPAPPPPAPAAPTEEVDEPKSERREAPRYAHPGDAAPTVQVLGHRPGDPGSQVAQAILEDALTRGASHIHLEQRADELTLRLRIDGVMHEKSGFAARLPETIAPKLIETIKSFAPEDTSPAPMGFTRDFEARTVTFRLTEVPMIHGERIVLSVLDPQVTQAGLGAVNLSVEHEKLLHLLTRQSDGLIVLAGPRRSGRDRLFTALALEIDRSQRSVAMIGKESSFEIEQVTYCPSTEDKLEVMEALVSADTDVILIDELTDEASVLGSLNAANEGLLVLAGISAKDIPDALEQIIGTSPAPWVFGSSLLGVIAAHQVRTPCPNCKTQEPPDAGLLGRLGVPRGQIPGKVWTANQCEKCFKTGYRGVSMLLSVLEVERTVAKLLRSSAPPSAILESATDAGMKSLGLSALQMIQNGTTTLDELARVLP
jgi:type II secretory ATPase GspE/PulE/Tfp pilus assembly ATPase PilB-like protein